MVIIHGCMTASGSGKKIGFWRRIETGTERTTIGDSFNITQTVRDTGIHLKGDEEQWRQASGSGPLAR